MKTLSPTSALPALFGVVLAAAATVSATTAAADEPAQPLWMTSAEAGVGPVDDELFVHLTPRLTHLRDVPAPLCEAGDCRTYLEVSAHVPLRVRPPGTDDDHIRRQDWLELSDFARILRRLEYGTPDDSFHLRTGEIGPVSLGHGTIVNGYYNVVTTDHYRLGVTGRLDADRWGAQLLVNDLTGPNLVGARARYRPPKLYEEDSEWRRWTVGTSLVTDLTAPDRLAGDDGQLVAGPGLHPVVDDHRTTAVAGIDVQYEAFGDETWSLAPYTDLNHHFGLGTGLHTGLLVDRDFGDTLRLSSRLEYRLLGRHYVPDYFDPVYEITRYRHPHLRDPATGYPGPKHRAAASTEAQTRHGGFGQLQARIGPWLTVSAAYSDATGPTGSDLRLRASFEDDDRLGVGLFHYQFAPGSRDLSSRLAELANLDGALTALEARYTLWGPLYAQGQYGRQWRLHEDGRFSNVHLWKLGLGAGTRL